MATGLDRITARERLTALGTAARRSQQLADDDRAARDAEIERADLGGMSVREIAECVGLSHGHVHKVVLARTAARQEAFRNTLQV